MNYWEINPMHGLGEIRFSQTIEETAAQKEIYALPSNVSHEKDRLDGLDEFAEQFGISVDDTEAIREVSKRFDDILKNRMTAYHIDSNLALTYDNDHLIEIQISRGVPDLHYKGSRFFHTNPREFLAKLQKENGEPPLVSGPDCVFKNIYVYVWSAFKITAAGNINIFNEHDEEAQDKSIILSPQPRNPDEDFSEYKPVSFIDLN